MRVKQAFRGNDSHYWQLTAAWDDAVEALHNKGESQLPAKLHKRSQNNSRMTQARRTGWAARENFPKRSIIATVACPGHVKHACGKQKASKPKTVSDHSPNIRHFPLHTMMSSLVCSTKKLQTQVTTANAVGSEIAWSKSAV